jgi:hypothetical protein
MEEEEEEEEEDRYPSRGEALRALEDSEEEMPWSSLLPGRQYMHISGCAPHLHFILILLYCHLCKCACHHISFDLMNACLFAILYSLTTFIN